MPKSKKENIKTNSSLAELVTQYDQQFMVALPKLYKKKAEREIVEAIVVPHFRAELAKVLNDFQEQRNEEELPILPDEVPVLCEAVDAMIEANKVPLLVDEYFGRGLARINKMREEAKEQLNEVFYAHCREILEGKGVSDRRTLLQKGVQWFMKETFPPCRKGMAFAGAILGRVIRRVTLETLNEIADVLNLAEVDNNALEKERETQKEALLQKGVKDRRILLQKGSDWFIKETFPPYGKGMAFAGAILGRVIRRVTLETLNEIADILQFPKINESKERETQKETLLQKGVKDRRTLLQKGPKWFEKERFPLYGKGKAFAGMILGRVIKIMTLEILNEIADILELPEVDEEVLEKESETQRQALERKGVINRRTLIQKGPKWFGKEEFPPYGKGKAFVSAILGHIERNITLETLNEIADILELPD